MDNFVIPYLTYTKLYFKALGACQNVYEEKYIGKYDLHPLMVVGYEGTVQNLNILIFYTD